MKDLLYQITTKEMMSTVKRMGYINNFTKVLFICVYYILVDFTVVLLNL